MKKTVLFTTVFLGSCVATILAANAGNSIGVAAAVDQNAHSTLPGGKIRTMRLGNKVYFNERIDTEGVGIVQLLFTDGSTIMVGANASLVIDEYIYDANKGTGKLAISFGKGVMRFIGGKLSKNKGGVIIRTAVGTAGVRGGIANIGISGNKGVFSFLYGHELTFKGINGERRRIYTQGYTLLAETNRGRAYRKLVIRRTLRGDSELFARKLTGVSTQQGGARQRPTNSQVSRSQISRGGSSIPFPRIRPSLLPLGVVSTSQNDLERDRLDNSNSLDACGPSVGIITSVPGC